MNKIANRRLDKTTMLLDGMAANKPEKVNNKAHIYNPVIE